MATSEGWLAAHIASIRYRGGGEFPDFHLESHAISSSASRKAVLLTPRVGVSPTRKTISSLFLSSSRKSISAGSRSTRVSLLVSGVNLRTRPGGGDEIGRASCRERV